MSGQDGIWAKLSVDLRETKRLVTLVVSVISVTLVTQSLHLVTDVTTVTRVTAVTLNTTVTIVTTTHRTRMFIYTPTTHNLHISIHTHQKLAYGARLLS